MYIRIMKKIFTLLFVLATTLCASAKDVPYTVGSTAFNTPYYGEVSDILSVNAGQTGHFKFVNYNNNGGNWNNYAIVINEGGTDKIILRADNWENVQASNAGCVSDFNWDTFMPDMNSATITTDVLYENGVVTITNEIKTTSQKTYHYSFSKAGFTADYVDMKLTVDNSYLVVQEQSVTGGEPADEPQEVLYTVGAQDFTTPYYGATSNILPVYDGQTGHLKFVNHNNNGGNWNNFVIVINEAGTDKIILRADSWENVQTSGNGVVNDYNWDTFVADMNDATVTTDIHYENGIVTITNEIKTKDKKTYHLNFSKDGFSADYVDMKLTVDNCYLEILEESVPGAPAGDEYTTVTDGTTTDYYPVVGTPDCSAAWWTMFSEIYNIKYGDTAHFQFINYTAGQENWQNWALLVRSPEVEGETAFTEYVVYRADAFGWGEYYDGGKTSSNFNWNTFKTDMNGALVDVNVTLNTGKVTIAATVQTTTGTVYFCNYETKAIGEPEAIAAQFTVENAYLAESPNNPTGINTVKTVSDVKKMVENNQIVIMKNGKKYNTAGAMLY